MFCPASVNVQSSYVAGKSLTRGCGEGDEG